MAMPTLVHKGLIFWIFMGFVAACGASDDNKDEDTKTGATLSWATDIAPIVKANCATSGCHGKTGAASKVYEDNEAAFKADKSTIKTRLALPKTNAQYMPQGITTFSDENKNKLINFLDQ